MDRGLWILFLSCIFLLTAETHGLFKDDHGTRLSKPSVQIPSHNEKIESRFAGDEIATKNKLNSDKNGNKTASARTAEKIANVSKPVTNAKQREPSIVMVATDPNLKNGYSSQITFPEDKDTGLQNNYAASNLDMRNNENMNRNSDGNDEPSNINTGRNQVNTPQVITNNVVPVNAQYVPQSTVLQTTQPNLVASSTGTTQYQVVNLPNGQVALIPMNSVQTLNTQNVNANPLPNTVYVNGNKVNQIPVNNNVNGYYNLPLSNGNVVTQTGNQIPTVMPTNSAPNYVINTPSQNSGSNLPYYLVKVQIPTDNNGQIGNIIQIPNTQANIVPNVANNGVVSAKDQNSVPTQNVPVNNGVPQGNGPYYVVNSNGVPANNQNGNIIYQTPNGQQTIPSYVINGQPTVTYPNMNQANGQTPTYIVVNGNNNQAVPTVVQQPTTPYYVLVNGNSNTQPLVTSVPNNVGYVQPNMQSTGQFIPVTTNTNPNQVYVIQNPGQQPVFTNIGTQNPPVNSQVYIPNQNVNITPSNETPTPVNQVNQNPSTNSNDCLLQLLLGQPCNKGNSIPNNINNQISQPVSTQQQIPLSNQNNNGNGQPISVTQNIPIDKRITPTIAVSNPNVPTNNQNGQYQPVTSVPVQPTINNNNNDVKDVLNTPIGQPVIVSMLRPGNVDNTREPADDDSIENNDAELTTTPEPLTNKNYKNDDRKRLKNIVAEMTNNRNIYKDRQRN